LPSLRRASASEIAVPTATATATPAPPDLVASIQIAPNKTVFSATETITVQVVVTNEGASAAGGFWVDFYINPASIPQQPNTSWADVCSPAEPVCYGITWGVTTPLEPGERIVLTSSADSYFEDFTNWEGRLPVGETVDLYAYVDSWNPGNDQGLIIESNETNNLARLTGLQVLPAEDTPEPSPEPTPEL
jgi:hypothetical protein